MLGSASSLPSSIFTTSSCLFQAAQLSGVWSHTPGLSGLMSFCLSSIYSTPSCLFQAANTRDVLPIHPFLRAPYGGLVGGSRIEQELNLATRKGSFLWCLGPRKADAYNRFLLLFCVYYCCEVLLLVVLRFLPKRFRSDLRRNQSES